MDVLEIADGDCCAGSGTWRSDQQPRVTLWADWRLLPDEVFHVLVVFLADVFDQLAAEQGRLRGERPRLRKRLRIVDRVLDLQVAEVRPADALGHFHVRRMRDARLVEPGDVVLPDGLDDERVAL